MSHPMIRKLFVPCLLLATSSCADPDQRLLELSRRSLHTQASQNAQQAEQSQAVAEATRELLSSQKSATDQQHALQQQLHSERQQLNARRETLDDERRKLDVARIREPLIAEALLTITSWSLAAIPLILCWLLLRRREEVPVEPLMTELLLEELTVEQSRRLPQQQPPSLPDDTRSSS
ncbi:MAG: hypothetical protein KDA68_19260 [Planctomycetaceae bacterium]|nr:hypothetical protein [Planctomycetaceae bacterium]